MLNARVREWKYSVIQISNERRELQVIHTITDSIVCVFDIKDLAVMHKTVQLQNEKKQVNYKILYISS